MRRIVTALLAVPVVLLAAMPANADRPIEDTQENLFLGCTAQTDIGRVEANIDAGVDWSYGGVVVFEDGSGEPYLVPDIQGEPPEPAPVIGDGVAEIDVGLLEQMTGEPAGHAAASFSFEPFGDPYPIDERFRDGNRWITQTGSWTDLAVAGSYSITLIDGTMVAGEFDECGGGLVTLSYRETNPHTYVGRFESADLYCTIPYGEGVVEVGASEWDQDANAYLAIFEYGNYMNPPTATGDTPINGLSPGPLAVTFDLFDGQTGEPLGQTATLDATIIEGDTIPIDIVSQYYRETGTQTEWTATGTLSLPDGTTLDLDGYCYGGTWEVKTFAAQPNGPKPTGKAPRNDSPEGALLLSRGDNTQTKAAEFDPEAACQIGFEEETFDVPLVKTVWYEITGTGEPVTVTTAGTRFDTVLGVYDHQLTQLGCVDDVADGAAYSLQAAIEFPTQEGDTYYIQAGGFGDQYGLLKIHTK